MQHSRGRVIEVASLADLDRRLAAGATSMTGWHLQDLDLTGHREALRRCRVAGALFVGCRFGNGDEESVRARGAVVFPDVPGVPVDTYRTTLYTAAELFDSPAYAESLDARAYAWAQQPGMRGRDATLARALHDHSVDEALRAWVTQQRREGRPLVGVMGGHALVRGGEEYAAATRLGRALASSLTVATGGGPGAMEAANLGAHLSGQPEDAVDHALETLAAAPSFHPSVGAWAEAAFAVLDRFPGGAQSLGIPTWHYGHEPPNPFATAIAKYFGNPGREAVLLEVCDAGIVFLPGAGGTVQEIFQDGCENYYADESSLAPMVLVGRRYWTEELPAWPLLRALARGRPMEAMVHLVDTVEEATDLMVSSR
ncbi:LOG family protein [Nocardioides pacificus]